MRTVIGTPLSKLGDDAPNLWLGWAMQTSGDSERISTVEA